MERPGGANQAARGGAQHSLMPGIALCAGIALTARLLQALEERVLGHPYLEGLVLAILLGMAVRTAWEPGEQWRTGIRLSAGRLLEVAVALLGSSLDLDLIPRDLGGGTVDLSDALIVPDSPEGLLPRRHRLDQPETDDEASDLLSLLGRPYVTDDEVLDRVLVALRAL